MAEENITNINKRKEEYEKYLKSDRWKSLRSKVIWSGKICDICRKAFANHVHHRVYKNFIDVVPEELIAVCEKCHAVIHKLIERGSIKSNSSSVEIRRYLFPSQLFTKSKKKKRDKWPSGTEISNVFAEKLVLNKHLIPDKQLKQLPKFQSAQDLIGKRIPFHLWKKLNDKITRI